MIQRIVDCHGSKVGILGFSAGGHLASTAGTHSDDGDQDAAHVVDRQGCRPDFVMLAYPVVTMGENTHAGSCSNLLGPDPSAELIQLFSNEKQVTARTPPMFLAHAVDDYSVPPDNSRALFEALQGENISTEYLELPSGGHGFDGYQGPNMGCVAREIGGVADQAKSHSIAQETLTSTAPPAVG